MSELKIGSLSKDTKDLPALVGDLVFFPEKDHQRLKAQFWARFESSPFADAASISLSTVQEKVSDPRLRNYWALPGFKEWFLNKDEARERLEYLFSKALDAAEVVLEDLDPKSFSAKVNLIKLLAELTGRLQTRGGGKDEKFSDSAINDMSEAELKKWLNRKGVTVSAEYKVKPTVEKFEP